MVTNFASTKSKLDLVIEMETAAGAQNWDRFRTFFVENVFFQVGASQEMRGSQDIIDYLTWLFSNAKPNLPFDFRGTWEIEDTVIIEMDTKCFRHTDGKPISFPCTDILKFAGDKIREWRVYPDQSELWVTDKL